MWRAHVLDNHFEINILSGAVRKIGDNRTLSSTSIDFIHGDYNRDWLKYLSLYGFNAQRIDLESIKTNLTFEVVDARLIILPFNVLPVVTAPIETKPGFRLVPSYPHLSVSYDGRVINNETGGELKSSKLNQYDVVTLYSGPKGRKTITGKHRLIAEAWVVNDDPTTRCIINHKDGVRDNNDPPNLEWVTVAENNLHAYETGLKEGRLACRVYDIDKKEEVAFDRYEDLKHYVGATGQATTVITQRHVTIPYKGRFEIRLGEDDRPWVYQGREDERPTKYGQYITRVLNTKTNETKEFRMKWDFLQYYKLWNINESIYVLAKHLEQRSPELKVTIVNTYEGGNVQAMCLTSGDVITFPSIREAARRTGISFTQIQYSLKRGGNNSLGDYAFRREEATPWSIQDIKPLVGSKREIQATNKDQVRVFKSLRAAAEHFGVDRSVIKTRIQKQQPLNDYYLNYASPLLSQGNSETLLIAGTY